MQKTIDTGRARLAKRPRRAHGAALVMAGLLTAVAAGAAVLAGASAARAKDCGERPTGKNPSVEELARVVEELSMAFQVPTEIIKAVAHRESSVQQWRPDGSLVLNETDCGIGMMQLTGATAEQFDVPRLKSEWRYNLEAGVTVLQTKWKRGVRTHWQGKANLPAPDPAILENWYYALSLYQGKRTGEYPGKIFDHMKARPGRLASLLAAPVEVSNPDAAIPGFSYGQAYTALAGDKVVLEDGRTIAVKTTRGTIGDPELLAQLDQVLERADKERDKGNLRRAIRYYQIVAAGPADTAPARRAREALAEIDAAAASRLAEGRAAEASGDYAGALIAFDEVEDHYLGLPAAEEAARLAEAIRTNPELKARAAALEAEKEGRFLLEKAERALDRERLAEAVRLLRLCAERYPTTAAATAAQDRLRRIESDPDQQARLAERERQRAIDSTLSMAEGYLANGLYQRAMRGFEEVLRLVPEGDPRRERARDGLDEARRMDGY